MWSSGGQAGGYRRNGRKGWELPGNLQAGPGKLVVKMTDDLLVGIPRKDGAAPLAMVVDKRVDDGYKTLKPRQVEITFSKAVKSVDILEKGQGRKIDGRTVKLTLQAGGGHLLRLNGAGL